MKKFSCLVVLLLFSLIGIFAPHSSHARQGLKYAVTVTNVTRGQVITPPIVIAHDERFSLFTLGSEASPELVALAEEGDTAPLEALLETMPSVKDFVTSGIPLFPGESITLEVVGDWKSRLISAAGMLATSNDAFFAVRGARMLFGEKMLYANAYDAGSEGNSESCAHVPGPPCGSAGAPYPDQAEGFVHVHGGIHGGSDLNPAEHDWHNPVVLVTIEQIR